MYAKHHNSLLCADASLRRLVAAVGGGMQALLLVGEDGAVGAGVGRAQQHEAGLDLLRVQDVLANQLHVARLDAPGAGAAGTWCIGQTRDGGVANTSVGRCRWRGQLKMWKRPEGALTLFARK